MVGMGRGRIYDDFLACCSAWNLSFKPALFLAICHQHGSWTSHTAKFHLEAEELDTGHKDRVVLVICPLGVSPDQRSEVVVGHQLLVLIRQLSVQATISDSQA